MNDVVAPGRCTSTDTRRGESIVTSAPCIRYDFDVNLVTKCPQGVDELLDEEPPVVFGFWPSIGDGQNAQARARVNGR
jgi:hypothetical protein